MEKVISVDTVVEEYLSTIHDLFVEGEGETDILFINDAQSKNYLLVEFGLKREEWIYRVIIHVMISDSNEIILLRNNTELDIFTDLEHKGIDKDQLIVGWVSKETWEAFRNHEAA